MATVPRSAPSRASATWPLMGATAVGGVAALLVARKAIAIARDPQTWRNHLDASTDAQMRYRRAFLLSQVNALLQTAGHLVFAKAMRADVATVVAAYQVVWCNVFGFLIEDVLVSDEGQARRKEEGWRRALDEAFRNMTGKRYARNLAVVLLDMSVVSLAMRRTQGLVDRLPRPASYPKALLDIGHASLVGGMAVIAYGNALRSEWVFRPNASGGDAKLQDATLCAIVVGVALLALTQRAAADEGPPSLLESDAGRAAVFAATLAACGAVGLVDERPRTAREGRALYVALTVVCGATLLRKVARGRRLYGAAAMAAMLAPAAVGRKGAR